MRGASKRLTEEEFKTYYPFKVSYKLGNVARMSKMIPGNFADFVIYTSAIEHMHPEDGMQSLKECYKIMKPGAFMFLSCPNTPGNGYKTQYRAHVYEWGYDELKTAVTKIGFKIRQEVGLVMGAREMDEFYEKTSPQVRQFYETMKQYVPKTWLTAIMSVPYPKASKEILFIVER